MKNIIYISINFSYKNKYFTKISFGYIMNIKYRRSQVYCIEEQMSYESYISHRRIQCIDMKSTAAAW